MTTIDLAKKLTLAELMNQKLDFYIAEQRRMRHPENRMGFETVIAALRHLIEIEEAERKEWAKRLLTEVEGRLATLQVKRDSSNANELSVERASEESQKIRAELEGKEERVKE